MSDGASFSRPSLIAGESGTKWYEGAGVFEAAMGVKDGITTGGYWSAGGNGVVVGLSALSAVMDPFQVIFAAGVGWLMEHVAILREPLDWLAGDPKEIEGHAQTWRNLQRRTYEATGYFADRVDNTADTWGSLAADAYRRKAAVMADSALALGAVADAMAEATVLAGSIVGLVRNTLRDLIAEVVGAAAHGSTIGNTYRLEAAGSRLTEEEDALKALRTAYKTLSDGHIATHATSLRVAADATKEATKVNSLQTGGAAGDTLTGNEPAPPTIELPL